MEEIKSKWKKWVYWFSLGVAIICVYKILDNFPDVTGWINNFFGVIAPFLLGILIAYLLYLPCKKIEKIYEKQKIKIIAKKARPLSVITVYAIVVLILVILINFIFPVLIESITELLSNIQWYYENAINSFNNLPEDSFLKGDIAKDIIQNIQSIDIKQYLSIDTIFEYAKNAFGIISSVFDIFVTIIVSIYILAGRAQILKFVRNLAYAIFSEKTYNSMEKYFDNTNSIFFNFLASQFLDAIIVGILTTIAMTIMGVRYAPLLGFMIGLFNMIPYVGAIIAVVVAALITLITGGLSQAIWMIIIVTILQQIDANIINPKIIGNSLKISPLLVIFAITVGGAYFGILGMFLAVPVVAVIRILVDDFVSYRLMVKKREKKSIVEK